MKRILMAAAALLGVTSAQAADLPQRPEYKAPVMVAPAFSWTGFYAGFNAGYGFGKATAFGFSENLNGFVGGGQIGGNYQIGSFVVGLEGDFQGTTQSKSTSVTIVGNLVTEKDSVPYFGTIRGRAGVAFDRVFVYATGGWAYAQFKIDVTAVGVTFTSHANKGAPAYGGGVEWMFADRWSAKVEYIGFNTGTTNVTLFGATFPAKLSDNIVRAGINYHF